MGYGTKRRLKWLRNWKRPGGTKRESELRCTGLGHAGCIYSANHATASRCWIRLSQQYLRSSRSKLKPRHGPGGELYYEPDSRH